MVAGAIIAIVTICSRMIAKPNIVRITICIATRGGLIAKPNIERPNIGCINTVGRVDCKNNYCVCDYCNANKLKHQHLSVLLITITITFV